MNTNITRIREEKSNLLLVLELQKTKALINATSVEISKRLAILDARILLSVKST